MPQFVMVDTYPRATVDAEELRRSVLEVATRADTIETKPTEQIEIRKAPAEPFAGLIPDVMSAGGPAEDEKDKNVGQD